MTALFFKTAGAALMVASAFITGRMLAARQRATVRQIAGFLHVFRDLRSGIAYDRAPVGDILSRVEQEVAAACSGGGWQANGVDLSSWVASCDILSDGLSRLLKKASAELGRGYREEQIAVCDRYIAALEAQHREGMSRLREQTRLFTTLLPAMAVGAVLLLI